jgi:hypothetical protein
MSLGKGLSGESYLLPTHYTHISRNHMYSYIEKITKSRKHALSSIEKTYSLKEKNFSHTERP